MDLKLIFKPIFALSLLLVCFQGFAAEPNIEQEADQSISELYHNLGKNQPSSMNERLNVISAQLLNKPYLLGALGEGAQGRFDQRPLYRMDAFDCETFVDTALAIALANNLTEFQQRIRQIRYRNGQVSFLARNHFTDLDWNQNSQNLEFLKDITSTFHDAQNKPIAETATALINKPAWYNHFTVENIYLKSNDLPTREKRLSELKAKSASLKAVESSIAYIPLTVLFDKDGKENSFIFKQIPDGSIVEIIRPNWDLKKQIGTALNVSHLGFAFWKDGTLWFRQASSNYGRTIDVPLVAYLHDTLTSPTIKGINVQIIVPKHAIDKIEVAQQDASLKEE